MKNDDKENQLHEEKQTRYGEVIPTNFAWLTLEEQKKRANELAPKGKKER